MFSSSSSSSEDEILLIRRPKVYKERINYYDTLEDTESRERFCLSKPSVQSLLQQIEHLINVTNRGGGISPMCQLLLTLRLYATGSMLITVGDFSGVSKASASRIVHSVSMAIASLKPRYINMCRNVREMEELAAEFYQIAHFPRVIGTIDCTHVRIQSPGGEDAEIFRNRKGYFSLNVQTVCDPQLKIRNIVAKWPGSTHDQTIFNSSSLKRDLENGRYGHNLLLADGGYPVLPYLMTPLRETHIPAENLYNESHIRTRNTVERQYGVWKRRFTILSLGMKLSLDRTMTIIVATAVLHNLAIERNDQIDVQQLADGNDEELDDNDGVNINHHGNGHAHRQLLIEQHFTRLR